MYSGVYVIGYDYNSQEAAVNESIDGNMWGMLSCKTYQSDRESERDYGVSNVLRTIEELRLVLTIVTNDDRSIKTQEAV